jgi:hypothetical protein
VDQAVLRLLIREKHIEHVLEVRRIEPGRCGACGLIDAVALVKRPRP